MAPLPAIEYSITCGFHGRSLWVYARRRSLWGTMAEVAAANRDCMNYVWSDGGWRRDYGWDLVLLTRSEER